MTDTTPHQTSAPIWPVLWRGWRQKCPRCGTGRALHRYLKVKDHCDHCDLPLHQARADDGPAYLTILIVGHIAAPATLWGFKTFEPAPLVLATTVSLGATALSLWMLPRLKGAIIAFQWAKGMYGFDREQ